MHCMLSQVIFDKRLNLSKDKSLCGSVVRNKISIVKHLTLIELKGECRGCIRLLNR